MRSASGEETLCTDDVIDGRYRVVKPIGDGGMGIVYLAEHLRIRRKVAIKVLHAQFASDKEVVERFMNEARAAGTLGHPNIVESMDMGFFRDVPYIVFEYLEGSVLTDEVFRLGTLPTTRALLIAQQIASALDATHAAGIIHRDLKGDNVFLTHRGELVDHVKVLDFGISKFLEAGGQTTRPGIIMGTPEFMAPEQITAPDSVDARSDVYALGVILYEMLAGHRPFANDDARTLLHRIVHAEPPPLDRPEVPVPLCHLVARMLAKNPNDRVQTMADVALLLEEHASASDLDSSRRFRRLPTPPPRPMPGDSIISKAPTLRSDPEPAMATPRPTRSGRRGGYAWFVAAILVALTASQDESTAPARSSPPPVVAALEPRAPEARPEVPPAHPEPTPVEPPSSAAESSGYLTIETEPRAVVFVDGVRLAPGSVARRAIPIGRHVLVAKLGGRNARKEVAVGAGEHAVVALRVRPTRIKAPPAPETIPAIREPIAAASTAPPAPSEPAASPPRPVVPAIVPPKPVAVVPPPPPPPPPIGSLDAVPSIRVFVTGPLTVSEVENAIERVTGAFRACYRAAARARQTTPSLTIKLSFEIDELRTARGIRVTGDSLGVRACIEKAARDIRTLSAPDVGTVAVTTFVQFNPLQR